MLYVAAACQTFGKGMAFLVGQPDSSVLGAGKERKDTDLMSIQQDRTVRMMLHVVIISL